MKNTEENNNNGINKLPELAFELNKSERTPEEIAKILVIKELLYNFFAKKEWDLNHGILKGVYSSIVEHVECEEDILLFSGLDLSYMKGLSETIYNCTIVHGAKPEELDPELELAVAKKALLVAEFKKQMK